VPYEIEMDLNRDGHKLLDMLDGILGEIHTFIDELLEIKRACNSKTRF